MKTFEVSLGSESTGQHKDLRQKMFATRLSTGERLEVVDGSPVSISVDAIDADALMSLESQGFISLTLKPDAKPQSKQAKAA